MNLENTVVCFACHLRCGQAVLFSRGNAALGVPLLQQTGDFENAVKKLLIEWPFILRGHKKSFTPVSIFFVAFEPCRLKRCCSYLLSCLPTATAPESNCSWNQCARTRILFLSGWLLRC